MRTYRSSSWWLFPIVGMAVALILLFLAVRSLSGHEGECVDPVSFMAKSADDGLGYGVIWGPHANRQSIVVFGTGADVAIRFESYGPPASSLGTRGTTKQFSEFPPAATDLIRRALDGDPFEP